MVVFLRDAGYLVILVQVDGEQLVSFADRVALGEKLPVAQHFYRSIVVHAFCKLFHFTLQVCTVNHAGGMPYTGEIECLVVRSPAVAVYARLEGFCNVSLFAVFQIHYAKAVAVAFVSVAFHTLPGNESAVGGELRVRVVTHVLVGRVFLAEIAGLLGFQIIQVNVRIGRNSIFQSGFLAAGICDGFGVRTPGKLFDATERLHRRFVGFAGQDVGCFAHFISGKWSHERMRYGLYPFIPVLVHQVVYHHSTGLVQVRILVDGAFAVFHL